MSRNRYIAYLPTVPFGPGIKSGSEFRVLWDKFTKVLLNPKSTPEQKSELIKEVLYDVANNTPRLSTLGLGRSVNTMANTLVSNVKGVFSPSTYGFGRTQGGRKHKGRKTHKKHKARKMSKTKSKH